MAHVQKRVFAWTDKATGKKRTSTAWQARYRAPDGRERTKRFDRKVDAEKWLTTNGADVARGQWVDPSAGKMKFRPYSEGWLATKADVAARTLINIEGRLNNHAIPYFGGMALGDVKPSNVRAFVAGLSTNGLSPSTVKGIYLTTAQVFAQAVTDGILARTPCRDIKLPSDRRVEAQHFLTPEQVNDLAGSIDPRYRALIYTAAYGGLRAGELVALRVRSTQLGELGGTLTVAESASEVRGALIFGTTKTGRARVVGTPKFLSELLADHIAAYSEGGLVFTAKEGGPIRHRNWYARHFRPAVAKARALALEDEHDPIPEGLRFHDLRHTCAAILIANGRHMEEVKEHLGHSTIRVTSDRYGHLFPSARQAIADSLEATFRETDADILRTSGSLRAVSGA